MTKIEGQVAQFVRVADSGNEARFHFCPICGSTVYWQLAALPDFLSVAVGAFADPGFSPPTVSVYELRRHAWVGIPVNVEHID